MSKIRIRLVAFKDEAGVWGNLNLKKLMKRTLRIEERMTTKVMLETEQARYNTFCERIEFYAGRLALNGSATTCDLDEDYADLLATMVRKNASYAREKRLTATFCPHELLNQYLESFIKLARETGLPESESLRQKIAFYRKAIAENLNVVELQQPWLYTKETPQTELNEAELYKKFLALEVADEISADNNSGPKQALRDQFDRVIDLTKKKSPAAMNFSDLRHDIIAEIIREYIYKNGTPMYVGVTYGDGSSASPLPIMTVRFREEEKLVDLHKEPVTNVGMMSARHSNDGLDKVVTSYWFRNQEISIGRTQAETDEVAYQKSKDMFALLRKEGKSRIAFYQTGFQPAVVGFYRALTEELIVRAKQPASLEVIPYYFLGGSYVKGRPWN